MPALLLLPLVLLIAFVYSSVGHGGASGYLALMALLSVFPDEMSAGALVLNLLVAGTAFLFFQRSAGISWRLVGPFLAASIPAAFLGGLVRIPHSSYSFLLACVLIFAGLRLWQANPAKTPALYRPPSLLISLAAGGAIGLLSGVLGIGGGIFLSPLLLLFGWAGPRETAASSSFFIWANSLAGLAGRVLRHHFSLPLSSLLWMMVGAAFVGGILGSYCGANRFPSLVLRRILAIVLFSASLKLFLR